MDSLATVSIIIGIWIITMIVWLLIGEHRRQTEIKKENETKNDKTNTRLESK